MKNNNYRGKMNFDNEITKELKVWVRQITSELYTKPSLRLCDIVYIVSLEDVGPKDIQNWTNRNYLKPSQVAPRKPKLYSMKDAIQACVIGYLYKTNSFNVANSIGVSVAELGDELVEERAVGYDLLARALSDDLMLYYYSVKGDDVDGVFVQKYNLAKIITGERSEPKVSGVERRVFEAESFIFNVMINVIKFWDLPNKHRR